MTTLPGLSVACQFIYWFAGLISRSEFSKDQVEARQPMIEEIMRTGYTPTPEMLETVRRACGVFYPTIDVVHHMRLGIVGKIEAADPRICLDLSSYRSVPNHWIEVRMVRVTGGINRTLSAYLAELQTQGFKTAGALVASNYLRGLPVRALQFHGEFYYNEGDRVMNQKGEVGITSASMRDFDCDGSLFLVVRR